ncbi:MAG: carbamoyltransferase C-terminal domain-containing protein [Acidobacteriota bacterium]|jgi:carbamoyltransferase
MTAEGRDKSPPASGAAAGRSSPLILGISSSHNGSACLMRGDEILVAIQEERLSRVKRDRIHGGRSFLSWRYCLDAAGVELGDIDLVVCCAQDFSEHPSEDISLNRELHLRRRKVPWITVSHHLAHAVAAYTTSGFEGAAVLVIDGLGSPYADLSEAERSAIIVDEGDNSWESISLFEVDQRGARALEKQVTAYSDPQRGARGRLALPDWDLPYSGTLGRLYGGAANQIFGDPTTAGKVMGLAAYGRPEIPTEDFYEVRDGAFKFLDRVPNSFATRKRWPQLRERYEVLAASVQAAVEEAILMLVRRLQELTPYRDFCYAGGVALNSVANERIIRECGFDNVYIMPAAEDSGVSIGAAYYGLMHLTGSVPRRRLDVDAVGRTYSPAMIQEAIGRAPCIVAEPLSDTVKATIDRLLAGEIGGWFQGRSELGPRALGSRSIICDPRPADAKERLNARVKRREMFRPFAPFLPLEDVAEWFELGSAPPEAPFMLRVLPFKPDKAELVPAVVHADGTGRVQTVTRDNGLFYDLAVEFKRRTGIPVLLNTSFNVAGEPIVETPADALWTLLEVDLDFCVLGDTLVTKQDGYESLLQLTPAIDELYYQIRRRSRAGSLPPGRIGAGLIDFEVETPWGSVMRTLNGLQFAVLAEIDGVRSGWEILERLNARRGSNVSDAWLLETLALLRRLGILTLA